MMPSRGRCRRGALESRRPSPGDKPRKRATFGALDMDMTGGFQRIAYGPRTSPMGRQPTSNLGNRVARELRRRGAERSMSLPVTDTRIASVM